MSPCIQPGHRVHLSYASARSVLGLVVATYRDTWIDTTTDGALVLWDGTSTLGWVPLKHLHVKEVE